MDYGFPSGQQLLEFICEEPFVDRAKKTLPQLGHEDKFILLFREELRGSQASSVDAFLEHRPEFLEVGKAAMALALLPIEATSCKLLAEIKNRKHWYKYFFNGLDSDFEDFGENRLSIFTLNYDRSLEYYLHRWLQKGFGRSYEECAQNIQQIPIVHLYGQLGLLPWQETQVGDRSVIPYDGIANPQRIEKCVSSIRIPPEGGGTTPEFQQAYGSLCEAAYIYFLGFGYHPESVRRLRVAEFSGKKPIGGTCFNLSGVEKRKAAALFNHKIELVDCDCLTFFKDHVALY